MRERERVEVIISISYSAKADGVWPWVLGIREETVREAILHVGFLPLLEAQREKERSGELQSRSGKLQSGKIAPSYNQLPSGQRIERTPAKRAIHCNSVS